MNLVDSTGGSEIATVCTRVCVWSVEELINSWKKRGKRVAMCVRMRDNVNFPVFQVEAHKRVGTPNSNGSVGPPL